MGLLSKVILSSVLCAMMCATVFAERPDETALLGLWEKQRQDPENHTAIIQVAEAFEKSFGTSPLVPVASSLAAWHQLKSGNTQEAQRLFEELAAKATSPLAAAGQDMAFSWLTRMDMKSVKEGLRHVFAENIEYPDTLAPVGSLPANIRPPLADRWGVPWAYSVSDFKQIKAGAKSTFTLQSTRLGEMSDCQKALDRPYGGGESLVLTRMPPLNGKALLKVSGTGKGQVLVGEGAVAGRVSFPYCSDSILILSNGDYWFIEKAQQN